MEPLIAERAPCLADSTPWARSARFVLDRVLGFEAAVSLGETLADKSAHDIMDTVAKQLAQQVHIAGLHHIPKSGAALLVANHPTGIGDGVMMWHAIAKARRDVFFYANSDILRVLPQMNDVIVPVEWRPEKRTHAKSKATMSATRNALNQGQLGVIFPSGRLAKRRGLKLHERPWMTSAVALARKYDVPLIPINIRARNSALFYVFDGLHSTLRDITLFHETLNKARQPFQITIGAAFDADTLSGPIDEISENVRRHVVALGSANPKTSPTKEYPALQWIRRLPEPLT